MTSIAPVTRLTGLVEAALGQSRTIRAMLHDQVVPHLPPMRRGAAEHVAKQLAPRRIFRTEMLHDLDALIALLEREAEAGTHVGWEADEGHTRGGWPKLWRDERAASLAASAVELRRFQNVVAAVLDALEAERLTNRLTSGD